MAGVCVLPHDRPSAEGPGARHQRVLAAWATVAYLVAYIIAVALVRWANVPIQGILTAIGALTVVLAWLPRLWPSDPRAGRPRAAAHKELWGTSKQFRSLRVRGLTVGFIP